MCHDDVTLMTYDLHVRKPGSEVIEDYSRVFLGSLSLYICSGVLFLCDFDLFVFLLLFYILYAAAQMMHYATARHGNENDNSISDHFCLPSEK